MVARHAVCLCAALLLGAGCAASLPRPAPAALAPEDAAALLRGRALMVPVLGVWPQQVPDTFDAPRDGGRRHEASDIPAPRGTPVLSADDGRVVRVGVNRRGGNMIYATDPSGGLVYYYAHLDGFAPGLSAGQALRRGDVLGFVGTTGNAPRHAPHLHFQLMRRRADGSIYGGPPIDARPFFAAPGEVPAAPGLPGGDRGAPPLVSAAPPPQAPPR